jgi:glycerophosphoryl diester phosphodiesterase
MKKVDKAGLKVTIWTADNPRWIKRGTNLGLYAVITNSPANLLRELNGNRKRIGSRDVN